MKQLLKTNSKKALIVILFTIVTVVAVISALNQNDLKIQEPDTTQQTQVADVDATEPTDDAEQSTEEASSEDVNEFEPELTEEAEETAKPKDEVETKKEPVTKKPTPVKKPETTTQKSETPTKKPVETPTKKPSTVTYNGHKPYEVFVDETGTRCYYTEGGILCTEESLTAKPITPEYDADCCYKCGSKDCQPAMNSYYCVICEENISSLTCHPKSHYNASH